MTSLLLLLKTGWCLVNVLLVCNIASKIGRSGKYWTLWSGSWKLAGSKVKTGYRIIMEWNPSAEFQLKCYGYLTSSFIMLKIRWRIFPDFLGRKPPLANCVQLWTLVQYISQTNLRLDVMMRFMRTAHGEYDCIRFGPWCTAANSTIWPRMKVLSI